MQQLSTLNFATLLQFQGQHALGKHLQSKTENYNKNRTSKYHPHYRRQISVVVNQKTLKNLREIKSNNHSLLTNNKQEITRLQLLLARSEGLNKCRIGVACDCVPYSLAFNVRYSKTCIFLSSLRNFLQKSLCKPIRGRILCNANR